jgi:SAM-dependent methyltransferase
MTKPLCCRSCGKPIHHVVVDLGVSPLSNRYLRDEDLEGLEPFYPLKLRVCDACWLVQIPEFVPPSDIFRDYAYFSSFSDSWLKHCSDYVDMITGRLKLGPSSQVVELASNDGYLLQYFVNKGIPATGVEPAANVAEVAIKKGVPTLAEFFGRKFAHTLITLGKSADLVIANNVLAHVPDLNDFIGGIRMILKPGGVLTGEFPHLKNLFEQGQFDTIYHEHFSYFSLIGMENALARHDLVLFDVQQLPTHGGSLRIFARRKEDTQIAIQPSVKQLRDEEIAAGYQDLEVYRNFRRRVETIKFDLVSFLIQARRDGKTVAGYGAPAKGNSLLMYCGIRTDLLAYTVDRNPVKQGRYLPGVRIPICAPEKIAETKPDYVLILPWNLKNEIVKQMAHIREWGGKFVVPIPNLEIIP